MYLIYKNELVLMLVLPLSPVIVAGDHTLKMINLFCLNFSFANKFDKYFLNIILA